MLCDFHQFCYTLPGFFNFWIFIWLTQHLTRSTLGLIWNIATPLLRASYSIFVTSLCAACLLESPFKCLADVTAWKILNFLSCSSPPLLPRPSDYTHDLPERYDPQASIDASAVCVQFNRNGLFAGQLLAVGRYDGVVTVYDFSTREVLRAFEGHVKGITSVCWSRDGRYLLSASTDWNVIVWDLAPSPYGDERAATLRFDAPVLGAHLSPVDSDAIVVVLGHQSNAVLILGERRFDLRCSDSVLRAAGLSVAQPDSDATDYDDSDGERADSERVAVDVASSVRFTPDGRHVYVGSSAGAVHVFDVATQEHIFSQVLSAPNAVRSIAFDESGIKVLVNSADRCIRLCVVGPRALAETHKLQDIVNKTQWNSCLFSEDSEYVIGGAGSKSGHNIYIWYTSTGGLVKRLDGPSDPLEACDWHPLRPLIASVSAKGIIYTWSVTLEEKWGAYAPGFVELEENLKYDEREDEFDIENASAKLIRKQTEQDKAVDLLPQPVNAFYPQIILDTEYIGEPKVIIQPKIAPVE